MCLAIPMQIKVADGLRAQCVAHGIERDVSLALLRNEPLSPGDYVLVHVGYAIQKLTAQEVESAWDLLDSIPASDA